MAIKFDDSFRSKMIMLAKIVPELFKCVYDPSKLIRQRALVVLRNLALVDKMRSILINNQSFEELASSLDQDSLHHFLLYIANLAVNDAVAQTIGSKTLFQSLFGVIKDRRKDTLTSNCLQAVGNLCVDIDSCLSIISIFKNTLEEIFYGPQTSQLGDCLVIMHNLCMQNTYSFNEFPKTSGFFEELVACITSRDPLVQCCSLRLLLLYLKCEKTSMGFRRRILNTSALTSLMIVMSDERNSNSGKAHECFLELAGMSDADGAFRDDPFARISQRWKEEDEKKRTLDKLLGGEEIEYSKALSKSNKIKATKIRSAKKR